MNKNPERPHNMEEIFVETISPEKEEEKPKLSRAEEEIKRAVFG